MMTFDRFYGALVGLAVGDALGTTVEFSAPGSFEPLSDIVGGGPFGLEAGQWTDDTSMALCLAKSLVASGGFDARDQVERYVRWYREGYWSCTGRCFDIGGTTATALRAFERGGDPLGGPTDPFSAGNGSIMRLAPVAMFYADDPAEALERSAESSRTTHGAREAVDACRYFGGLIVGALRGVSKEALLSERYGPARAFKRGELAEKIEEVARGSFKERQPPEIKGSGYVIKSLEAALWAFYTTSDFRTGALAAVNLGDDADTTGAVYGQIAGAYYGAEAIPEAWRQKIAMGAEIKGLAEALFGHATGA
ncbi:ADP-ribosylglycohydrolase family protein [Lujinxingia vulgaris]|uniref:ADP-ribosylglycohydrolase family protein n=1 Tax=Lujinxingia vulgaris TaxID=2600176 RepID=A0A5C6XC78_9DELT|nr:ADP-ribosylglycohydrolase family protein [Lujinxingia vulgaris]TXD37317.1 ADP-ribosylglycohydrolase family protein [Lujinxingia vulgaris]